MPLAAMPMPLAMPEAAARKITEAIVSQGIEHQVKDSEILRPK